jgi:hypothetical protein
MTVLGQNERPSVLLTDFTSVTLKFGTDTHSGWYPKVMTLQEATFAIITE